MPLLTTEIDGPNHKRIIIDLALLDTAGDLDYHLPLGKSPKIVEMWARGINIDANGTAATIIVTVRPAWHDAATPPSDNTLDQLQLVLDNNNALSAGSVDTVIHTSGVATPHSFCQNALITQYDQEIIYSPALIFNLDCDEGANAWEAGSEVIFDFYISDP